MGSTATFLALETVVLFGVHVKVFSAIFGLFGVGLGHVMAPRPPEPLGWRRQGAVVAAGLLTSISITIATGQVPLLVLGWSIGIGWAGIAIFQIVGARAKATARTIGSAALEELSERLAAQKDKP